MTRTTETTSLLEHHNATLLETGSTHGDAETRLRPFEYLTTRHFWTILLIGQTLAFCITLTNTFTSILANSGNSVPVFQSLLNYILLAIIFVPYTVRQYGWPKYIDMMKNDGWKFCLLAFTDVEGNYFIVNAYQYTNMLSAALLDNLTIVFVVIFSFLFLRVRYHWTQMVGIVICVSGVILIVFSDVMGGNKDNATNAFRGDLFVVLSTAFYGTSNVLEEFLVSKRPYYEVLGQMGVYGTIVIGVQYFATGTDVGSIEWNWTVAGCFIGFNLALLVMYMLVPIMFRMSSSAFYNLSLLTSDFWALLIGVKIFGYKSLWLYPIGFTLTIMGVLVYNLVPRSKQGESVKPWLGSNQEDGITGIGTAKRTLDE